MGASEQTNEKVKVDAEGTVSIKDKGNSLSSIVKNTEKLIKAFQEVTGKTHVLKIEAPELETLLGNIKKLEAAYKNLPKNMADLSGVYSAFGNYQSASFTKQGNLRKRETKEMKAAADEFEKAVNNFLKDGAKRIGEISKIITAEYSRKLAAGIMSPDDFIKEVEKLTKSGAKANRKAGGSMTGRAMDYALGKERRDQQKRSQDLRKEELELRKMQEQRRREQMEIDAENRKRKGRRIAGGVVSAFGGTVGSLDDPTGLGKVVGGAIDIAGKAIVNPATALAEVANKLTGAFRDLYNSSISAYKGMETLKVNLSIISGSDSQGEALFNELAEYATKSPFDVSTTAEQATLLRQSGVYASDLLDTLKMIGDMAGGNAEKMRRISNDYAQITANGKANMLQMRQLANAGIPIYRELSKELGVSISQVRQLSKQGEISAETITKVFKNLTSEGGQFYNAVEKGSKTLAARTLNLEDIKNLALAEVGEGFQKIGGYDGTNTSFREALLDSTEKMWGYLKDWAEVKNIANNTKGLEKNEKMLQVLYDKLAGEDDLKKQKEILDQIERLIDAYTDEEKESISVQSFEKKTRIKNQLQEIGYEYTDLPKWMLSIASKYFSLIDFGTSIGGGLEPTKLSSAIHLTKDLKTLGGDKFTDDEWKAGALSEYKEFQDAAVEYFQKLADAGKSLYQTTNEMVSEYKQTVMYKEQEKEEQKKLFEQTHTAATEYKKLVGDDASFARLKEFYAGRPKDEFASFISDKASLLDVMEQFEFNRDKHSDENDWKNTLKQFVDQASLADDVITRITPLGSAYGDLQNLGGLLELWVKRADEVLDGTGNERDLHEAMVAFKSAFDSMDESKLDAEGKAAYDNIKTICNTLLAGKVGVNLQAADIDPNVLFPPEYKNTLTLSERLSRNARNVGFKNILSRTSLDAYKDSFTGTNFGMYGDIEYSSSESAFRNLKGTIFETVGAMEKLDTSIYESNSVIAIMAGNFEALANVYQQELNDITQLETAMSSGSMEDVIRLVSGMSDEQKNTFLKNVQVGYNGGNISSDNLRLENGRLLANIAETGKEPKWVDALSNGLLPSFDKLRTVLGENKDATYALYTQMKTNAIASKTLDTVRSDVQSVRFERFLEDSNFLQDNQLRVDKTLNPEDWEYAKKTFLGMFNSLVSMGIPLLEDVSEESLKKYNDSHVGAELNMSQMASLATLLDKTRNGTNKEIGAALKEVLGDDNLKNIINELNAYDAIGKTGKSKVIEPLWSRILGNGLGLDPAKIMSAGAEKDAYNKANNENLTLGAYAVRKHEMEQYTRNVSKSVLQTALRGGADTTQMMAMLSRTGQYKTDKYDPTKERVQQIDWNTTSKNLKEFALRVGQAAEVTSAYRQSVEDEVNTLADLLASMPTTFEDAANADNFKEQFLNVYKGSLKMGDKEVNIDADGNVWDMNEKLLGAAKDLIDQLEINEKTIKEANEQLKQRRKDLLEARKAETANSLRADALGNLDKNAISIALSSLGIESGSYLESILSKEAEIVVNEFKGSDDYKNLIGGNIVKEVLAKAVLADTKQYEEELAAAQKKVDEAQKTVNDFFFGTLTKMYEGEKGVNKNEIDEWLKETSKEDSERGRKIKNALDEYGKLIKTRDDYKSEKASVTRRDDNVKAEEEKAKKNSAKVLDSASEFNLILEKLLDVMKEYLNEDSEKISDLLEASNARIAYQEEYNRIATLGKMSVAERKMMAGGSLHQGNVDLLNRPKVSDKDMWAAGYLDFEKGATATLYSSSLSNENGFTITYTPILPNGTVLDEKSVEAYIQNILDGGNLTKEDVLKADSLGIVLGVHNSEQEASRFGYALHNNQADYLGMNTPSYFRERQLDYMYGMDSSTYNQFQSNQMASLKSRMFGNNGEFLAGGKSLKEQLSKALGKDFAEEYTSLLKDESLDPSEWSDRFRDMNEQLAKFQLGLNSIKEISKELNDSFSSMFDSFAWDVVTGGLETIGQSMTEMLAGVNDGTDAWKNFGQSFVQMTKSLLSNMGPMLMQAGLKMIIDSQNKGERWMGIALLAAGGLSSIMAGALGATSDDNSDSDKEKKLERLRDDLKDLLAQAKADAQYYEQNVSHQKALSVNGAYARNQKVNDAIITPNGNVISTHPDDYLIATKNPQGLMGNGKQAVTFSPSIVVNNNTGRALKVEPKYDENTGDINFTIEEMVVGIVNKGLAEGSFESGMGAREQSLRGRKVYA